LLLSLASMADPARDALIGGLAGNWRDLGLILPEVVLAAAFLFALAGGLLLRRPDRDVLAWVAIMGLGVALVALYPSVQVVMRGGPQPVYHGMFVVDGMGVFVKALVFIAGMAACMLAKRSRELAGHPVGEFAVLVLAACLGMAVLAGARNLLMLYLGLEFVSLPCYVLAGFVRRKSISSEAGVKYVIYGALSSGIMLVGISLVYGLTGTLDMAEAGLRFKDVLDRLGDLPDAGGAYVLSPNLALLLPVMIFAGLAYKIAAAPFHFWSPDVYEGAPCAATAFFSVAPKAAGFAAIIRFLPAFFHPAAAGSWLAAHAGTVTSLLAVIAIITMTVGNLTALLQHNVKRMLAFSSVAHAGYMLAALAVPLGGGASYFVDGSSAVLFYLAAYLAMNLGAFAAVLALENARGGSDLEDLRGVVRERPFLAGALCIFLFALVGLPPTGGFVAKWFVLRVLVESGSWTLAVFVVVNSVIALYYYMVIARTMVIDKPFAEPARLEARPSRLLTALVALLAAATLALQVCFGPVHDFARSSSEMKAPVADVKPGPGRPSGKTAPRPFTEPDPSL
jgi:NADH-quinone oxidoreductase subunit N